MSPIIVLRCPVLIWPNVLLIITWHFLECMNLTYTTNFQLTSTITKTNLDEYFWATGTYIATDLNISYFLWDESSAYLLMNEWSGRIVWGRRKGRKCSKVLRQCWEERWIHHSNKMFENFLAEKNCVHIIYIIFYIKVVFLF